MGQPAWRREATAPGRLAIPHSLLVYSAQTWTYKWTRIVDWRQQMILGWVSTKRWKISPSQYYMINKDIRKLLCEVTRLEGMTTQVSFWGETLNLANNCKNVLTKQDRGSSALKKGKLNRIWVMQLFIKDKRMKIHFKSNSCFASWKAATPLGILWTWFCNVVIYVILNLLLLKHCLPYINLTVVAHHK